MNPSERAMKWQKDNPAKTAITRAKQKAKRKGAQKEALKAVKKAKFKTPMRAIKAFCRFTCPSGTIPNGGYLDAIVDCPKKNCVFFPFRNGSPDHIKRGLAKPIPELDEMRNRKIKGDTK